MSSTENAKIAVSVGIAVLSFVVSAFSAYMHNDKEVATRLATVEAKQGASDKRQDDFKDQLNRIEDMVTDIYKRGR